MLWQRFYLRQSAVMNFVLLQCVLDTYREQADSITYEPLDGIVVHKCLL